MDHFTTLSARALEVRQTQECYTTITGRVRCRYRSRWSNWGRWLVVGLVLAAFLVGVLAFCCIMARRRRRAGRKPMMGTGWVPQRMFYNNNNQQVQSQYAAPAYDPNAGYYGKDYAPPAGPPPGQAQSYYQPPAGPPPAHTR